jgi:hypothetical protein
VNTEEYKNEQLKTEEITRYKLTDWQTKQIKLKKWKKWDWANMNWETTEEMKNEIEQTWTEVEMTEQIKLRDCGEERPREWDEVKWGLTEYVFLGGLRTKPRDILIQKLLKKQALWQGLKKLNMD